jgi:hypothetical protein
VNVEFQCGVVGLIVEGSEVGRWVEVLDDQASTGGYLVLTFSDPHRSPPIFDAWVESIVDVQRYFVECGWTIRWVG